MRAHQAAYAAGTESFEEELRMTENASVPGRGRDLAMHNDWWASGWDHVLPRQGFPLTMLIGTAS